MGEKIPLYTFDFETDPFKFGRKPEPFLAGLYSKDFYKSFRNAKDLVNYIKYKKGLYYAHNGGRFDFLYLLDFFEPNQEIMLINGRIATFKIGEAIFRDSYLIIPRPLRSYKKDDIDYKLFEKELRELPENLKMIDEYCANDCKYLYELIELFHKKYGKKLTLAGSAMTFWKKITSKQTVAILDKTRRKPEFYKSFSEFYFGGRVECFVNGFIDSHIETYDINSAYSDAMNSFHPFGNIVYTFDKLPKSDDEISRSFIELDADSLGAFPLKDKFGTEFPSDGINRRFKITGWEYLSARDTNSLKNEKIIKVHCFQEKVDFNNYTSHFFKEKREAVKGSGEELMAKLFLNSYYGKLCANPSTYKTYYLVEQDKILEKEKEFKATFIDFIGKWALLCAPILEVDQTFYNVATGASITGNVRAKLWRGIKASKNVYYCDTDNIHSEKFNGKVGDNIGEWKHEFTATRAGYGGKKLYALNDGTPWGIQDKKGVFVSGWNMKGWKVASKGAKLTGQEIMDISLGHEIEYNQEAPSVSLKRGFRTISRIIKSTHNKKVKNISPLKNRGKKTR